MASSFFSPKRTNGEPLATVDSEQNEEHADTLPEDALKPVSPAASSLEAEFERLWSEVAGADLPGREYIIELTDRMLMLGHKLQASDIHLQPTSNGFDVKVRVDGLLRKVSTLPASVGTRVTARIKVQSELVVHRSDVPQEGRIQVLGYRGDMRVSVLPTIRGEKLVIRYFNGPVNYQRLDDLGFPERELADLRGLLDETTGAILVTGPAGSGKTTTLYACLTEIVEKEQGRRSLASLEDPVEVELDGVAQTQVDHRVHLDLAAGLRYLLRQDPNVIMMGEIRDESTALAALQAALTGHLLLSTFHAGSSVEAIARLLELNVEPYFVRSGILAVMSQRLVRRLCGCTYITDDPTAKMDLPVERVGIPVGCPMCHFTGYRGRLMISEMLKLKEPGIRDAISRKTDTQAVEKIARNGGMTTLWERAIGAMEQGFTSAAEVRRVLGFQTPEYILARSAKTAESADAPAPVDDPPTPADDLTADAAANLEGDE